MIESNPMKFQDKNGTEWRLSLTVGTIEDVKENTEIDFDELIKKPAALAEFMLADHKQLVRVLFVICQDQIEERSMTAKDFGRLFDRTTIDNAQNGLMESIMLFYARTSAGRVIQEQWPALLAKMDSELEKKLKSKMKEVFSN